MWVFQRSLWQKMSLTNILIYRCALLYFRGFQTDGHWSTESLQNDFELINSNLINEVLTCILLMILQLPIWGDRSRHTDNYKRKTGHPSIYIFKWKANFQGEYPHFLEIKSLQILSNHIEDLILTFFKDHFHMPNVMFVIRPGRFQYFGGQVPTSLVVLTLKEPLLL